MLTFSEEFTIYMPHILSMKSLQLYTLSSTEEFTTTAMLTFGGELTTVESLNTFSGELTTNATLTFNNEFTNNAIFTFSGEFTTTATLTFSGEFTKLMPHLLSVESLQN